jgi:hypothetical protein
MDLFMYPWSISHILFKIEEKVLHSKLLGCFCLQWHWFTELWFPQSSKYILHVYHKAFHRFCWIFTFILLFPHLCKLNIKLQRTLLSVLYLWRRMFVSFFDLLHFTQLYYWTEFELFLHFVNPRTGWHHRIWNKSSTNTWYLYKNSFSEKVNEIIIQY